MIDGHTVAVDVGAVAPAGVRRVVAEVFAGPPEALPSTPVVMTCLPGGGMSRRYFDLEVAGDPGTYSMAAYLAARGIIVITADHPGVGDSDTPDDGYELTPRMVADVDAFATSQLLDRLRSGKLLDGYPALPGLVSVGCGHSMGGLLTVHQQAHHRTHDALVLLGFAGGGLPDLLTDEERRYADDPEGATAAIARLAAARFGAAASRGATAASPFLIAVPVPDAALAAITAAGSNLLNLCGLFSMIPGVSSPELEAVDVPVLIGVGEHDITGASHDIPAHLPNSRDITLFVCPGAGHNHNVAPTRARLWNRLLAWIRETVAVSAMG